MGALLARTVEASPLRLLARTVEELGGTVEASPLSRLSEQAHAFWCVSSVFYQFDVFQVFTYHCALVCLELYCRSVLDIACFFWLSMLSSYCRRVLIALRSYSECKYFASNEREPPSGKSE